MASKKVPHLCHCLVLLSFLNCFVLLHCSQPEKIDLTSNSGADLKLETISQSRQVIHDPELKNTVITTRRSDNCDPKTDIVTLGSHNELRVRCKPFFPIGTYHINFLTTLKSEVPSFDWDEEQAMKELVLHGFNVVHTGYSQPSDDFMTRAEYHNLMVMPELSNFIRDHLGRWSDLEKNIKALSAKSQLLMYDLVDEPNPLDSRFSQDVEKAYQIIKKIDTKHPVHIDLHYNSFNPSPSWLLPFEPYLDILAQDPYPKQVSNPLPLSLVSAWMDFAKQHTKKPLHLIVQAFAGNRGSFDKDHCDGTGIWQQPTPIELRNMVYQGLVSGMKGLWYYSLTSGECFAMSSGLHHWFLPHSDLWNLTKVLNKEIHDYEKYFLIGDPDPAIKVQASSFVRWASFKLDGSTIVVLVSNNPNAEEGFQVQKDGTRLNKDRFGVTFSENLGVYGTKIIEL